MGHNRYYMLKKTLRFLPVVIFLFLAGFSKVQAIPNFPNGFTVGTGGVSFSGGGGLLSNSLNFASGPTITTDATTRINLNAASYVYIPTGVFYVEGRTHLRGGLDSDNTTLNIYGGSSGNTYFAGNVGVGATAPRGRLDVAWPGTGLGNIYFGDWTNGWALGENVDASLQIYKTANGTTLTSLMTILNGGNVGVGTASPGAKLDVSGSISASGTVNGTGLCISGDCKATWSAIGAAAGLPSASPAGSTLRADGTNWVANTVLYNNGTNVGVGTTAPGSKLDINGDVSSSDYHNANGTFDASLGGYSGRGASIGYSGGCYGGIGFNIQHTAGNCVYLAPGGDTVSYLRFDSGGFNFLTAPVGSGGRTLSLSSIMTLTAGGNLGIGVSPAYKLDVNGDIHANGWVRTDGASGWYSQTYGGGWYMTDGTWVRTYNGTSVWTASGVLGSDGGLTIGYSGTTPPSGGAIISNNVGIGTTNPMYKFVVRGSTVESGVFGTSDLTGSVGSALVIRQGATTGNTYSELIATQSGVGANANLVLNSSGGNIGIGTTAPNYAFEVRTASTNRALIANLSSADVNSNSPKLSFFGGNASTYITGPSLQKINDGPWGSGRLAIFQHPAGDYTTETEVMSITSGGNVGVGTSAPAAKLDVSGSINSTGTVNGTGLCISNDCKASWAAVGSASSGWTQSGNDVYKTITAGNVGVGTASSVEKLDVVGGNVRIFNAGVPTLLFRQGSYGSIWGGRITMIDYGDGMGLNFDTSNGSDVWGTRMVVRNNGNVGINTTAPSERLEINGNLKFTTANPNIIASSYFNAPGGAYFSSGTVYTEAAIQARGGIHNDSNTYLTVSGGTSGYTYFPGYVGVGTASPSAPFHVLGNAAAGLPVAKIENNSATNGTTLLVRQTTAGGNGSQDIGLLVDIQGANDLDNIANFRYYDGSTYTSRMAVKRGGNVGIGTTAPSARLHVATPTSGAAIMVGRASGNSSIAGAGDGYLSLDSNGQALILNHYVADNVWLATGGGNVGINTTGPGYKLDVVGNGAFRQGDNSYLYFGPNSTWGGSLYVGATQAKAGASTAQVISSNGNLHLDAGSSNDMYLNYYSSGRPIHAYGAFDTNSTVNATGLCIAGDCKTSWASVGGGIWARTAPYIYPVTLTDSVGIGVTNPVSKLTVSGGDLQVESGEGRFKGWYNAGSGLATEVGVSGGEGWLIAYDRTGGGYYPINMQAGSAVLRLPVNGIPTITNGLRVNGAFAANNTGFYFSSASAHYQPASNIPTMMIRTDDSEAGPIDTLSGLVLYNANGGQNTGSNITFVSREAVGNGNDVALSGIFGWKISAGNAGSWSAGGLRFWTKNYSSMVDAMAIDNVGNVGIGTTNPHTKLEVNGSIVTTGAYNMNNSLPAMYDISGQAIGATQSIYSYGSICASNGSANCSAAGGVVLGINNTTSNTNIPNSGNTFFNNGGNVGIGTTLPSAKLQVKGGDLIISDGAGGSYTGGGSGCPWCGVPWTGYSPTVGAGVGAGNLGGGAGGSFVGGYGDWVAGGGTGIYTLGGAGALHGFGGTGIYAKGGAHGVNVGGGVAPAIYADGPLVTSGGLVVGTYADSATKANSSYGMAVAAGNAYISGNVGIGTTNPTYKLDVVGSAWNNTARIYSTGSSSGLDFWDGGARRGLVYSDTGGFGLLNSGTGWALQIPYGTSNITAYGSVSAAGTVNGTGLCISGDCRASWAAVLGNVVFVSAPDGDRNAATKLPTTSGHGVRFDFANAGTTSTGGNYAGVMTYAPWDGTSASTGDASYQLAFGSTATNASGIPQLKIRNGIDSTWNSWKQIITDDGNGNVGIGLTNPASRLQVSGGYVIGDKNYGFVNADYQGGRNFVWSVSPSATNWGISYYQGVGTGGTDYFAFHPNGSPTSPTMTIGNPNVGIGTTAPAYPLQVNGNIAANNAILLKNANSAYPAIISITAHRGSNTMALGDGDGNVPLELFGNQIYFNTANGIITSDGKLGVGTQSPAEKFEVAGNMYLGSNTTYYLKKKADSALNILGFTRSDNSWGGNLVANGWSGYYFSGGLGVGGYDPGQSANLLVNGRVGIGTTNTATILDVVGPIKTNRMGLFGSYDSSQVQGIWSISENYAINPGANNFGSQYGMAYAYGTLGGAPFSGTHQILFVNNGTVGASIGLNGHAYFASDVNLHDIYFNSGPSITTDSIGRINLNATDYTYVSGGVFYVQGATHFRSTIDNDVSPYLRINGGTAGTTYFPNNVGIGTTAPIGQLESVSNTNWASGWRLGITSTSNDYPTFRLRALGSGKVSAIGNDNDGGLYFMTNGSDSAYGNQAMTILAAGYVGIGTATPGSALEVVGSVRASGNVSGTGLCISGDCKTSWPSGGSSQWTTSGSNIYYTTGNVGIGLTSPSQPLDVYGIISSQTGMLAPAYVYSSDRSLKTNISTINNPLAKILALRGVTFNWKKDNQPGVGLIAQEVEKVFPELVTTESNGLKGVEYGNLVAPLIEAVKAQQAEINNLTGQINNLEAKVYFLERHK